MEIYGCSECKDFCEPKYIVKDVKSDKGNAFCSCLCLRNWADNEVAESNYDPKTRGD
jgi:hypothetical protein